MSQETLSVLVPFFNERAGLESCVRTVSAFLHDAHIDFEIVLVDDASQDGSDAIAQRLAQELGERLRLVRHAQNQGPCSGLKTGPLQAKGEWTLLLPVDLAIPLEDILTFWAHRKDADIVLGYIKRSQEREGYRNVQSKLYTTLINRLFSLDLKQVNYVALYRTEVFRRIQLSTSGVALHAEILVRARNAGLTLRQLEVGYQPRKQGQATGSKPRVVWKTVQEIARLWRDAR
jgi:glycosyltransferase involved in cell wall biosynthesis